jgi:hypothetical protein
MWFDARAKLAEIQGQTPATTATTATMGAQPGILSQLSQLSQRPAPEMTPDELARCAFEERAAIRQFDGGQDRETAERMAWSEARRAAGVTALDDWRARADDPLNPENWR